MQKPGLVNEVLSGARLAVRTRHRRARPCPSSNEPRMAVTSPDAAAVTKRGVGYLLAPPVFLPVLLVLRHFRRDSVLACVLPPASARR